MNAEDAALADALAASKQLYDEEEEALRAALAASLLDVTDAAASNTLDVPPTPPTFEALAASSSQTIRPSRRRRHGKQRLQHEYSATTEPVTTPRAVPRPQNKSLHIPPLPTEISCIQPFRPPVVPCNGVGEHQSWHRPELPPANGGGGATKNYNPPVIAWLRQEMRLEDNPALHAASHSGRPVIPLFILPAVAEEGGWPLSGAAKYWQHHALNNLQHSLRERLGSCLVLRDASSSSTLLELLAVCAESGATDLHVCAQYEPWKRSRDLEIMRTLRESHIEVHEHRGSALYEPWDARPDEKKMHLGFGSVGFFLHGCQDLPEPPPPLPPPTRLRPPLHWPSSLPLSALGLAKMPMRADGTVVDWAGGMRRFWQAGEAGALASLDAFVHEAARYYEGKDRHRADTRATSILSPYLRFGELSARTVVHTLQTSLGKRAPTSFLRKFAWRDLAYWALWRFPTLADVSFRPHYEAQPWGDADGTLFAAWCAAKTGFPLVDAAMTQLWQVGWMPNYMRHVVAGFLVEFLNVDWRKGERWFAETLVDADTAINAFMWQNGGHSGMDQWNFVMHPVYAAKTCDPDGEYVRTWLPQLSKLPVEFIHCPWEAPFGLRASCRVVLGGERGSYPARVITDLEAARRRSHEAVMKVRRSAEGVKHVLPSGHEWVALENGQRVTLITRRDFKEGQISTRQTAEAKWDKSKRERGDLLGMAIKDSERESAL